MALESLAIDVGTSDTDVYEMAADLSGLVVMAVNNKTAGAVTYGLKVYRQASGLTKTIQTARSLAAHTFEKYPTISLAAGDKIIMSAASGSAIEVTGFVSTSASTARKGFQGQGAWSAVATYALNDIVTKTVTSRDIVYLSLQGGNLNQDPETETNYWMVIFDPADISNVLLDTDIGVSIPGLTIANVFTAPQTADDGALTDNTGWDGTTKQFWTVDVNGAEFDIANPTDLIPNTLYLFRITYTSAHTVNLGTAFKGAGLDDFVPTASVGAEDAITFISNAAGTELHLHGFELDCAA